MAKMKPAQTMPKTPATAMKPPNSKSAKSNTTGGTPKPAQKVKATTAVVPKGKTSTRGSKLNP